MTAFSVVMLGKLALFCYLYFAVVVAVLLNLASLGGLLISFCFLG